MILLLLSKISIRLFNHIHIRCIQHLIRILLEQNITPLIEIEVSADLKLSIETLIIHSEVIILSFLLIIRMIEILEVNN